MSLPSSGQLSFSQINVELGRSSTAEISLNEAENGTYATINTDSISRPSATNPASVSEWYSYNHSAVPPQSGLFGFSSSESGACLNLASPTTLYWDTGAFGAGKVLYTDVALTSELVGYLYVAYNDDVTVYNINSGNGLVGSPSGEFC